MKSMALWIYAVSFAISAPAFAAPSPYSGIVVFGGSLSDPGNLFALTGGVNRPPSYDEDAFLVPNSAYARGGLHLTNGAPWIELFARPLGLSASVQPAYRDANPAATNYAVAGARARDDGVSVNLADQLGQFVDDRVGVARPDELYVIDMGGNDIRDALAIALGGGDSGPVLQAAASSIAAALTQLHQMGARQFLVLSVPDISLIPSVRALNALYTPQTNAVLQLASFLTQSLNAGIDAIVAQQPSDAHVTRLDLFGRLHYIVGHPTEFGFTNVTDACITPNEAPFTCKNPDEYVFWDGVHPTEAVHSILAHDAEVALGL